MTICICGKHGRQPCEQISKKLHEEFTNGHYISIKIRDFSFIIEDFGWPFYSLQEEIEQLPETCLNGDFLVQSEDRLSEVLGPITIICLACLEEAMNGAPLPVKKGGS